jgi:hypothetical protein
VQGFKREHAMKKKFVSPKGNCLEHFKYKGFKSTLPLVVPRVDDNANIPMDGYDDRFNTSLWYHADCIPRHYERDINFDQDIQEKKRSTMKKRGKDIVIRNHLRYR